jgi:hypothetical protein
MQLIDPVSGAVWISGKKGRRPTWVLNHPEYKAKEKPVASLATNEVTIEDTSAYKLYKWTGISKSDMEATHYDRPMMRNHCLIVARNPLEASLVASPTFKFTLSPLEINTFWDKVDTDLVAEFEASGVNIKEAGVWQNLGDGWKKRNKV